MSDPCQWYIDALDEMTTAANEYEERAEKAEAELALEREYRRNDIANWQLQCEEVKAELAECTKWLVDHKKLAQRLQKERNKLQAELAEAKRCLPT